MRGLIYKVTCKPTQRSYIGKTRSTQQQRWYQHCSDAKRGSDTALHQSIREHGSGAFQVITLKEWDDISDEALQAAETYFIQENNTFHEGYNRQVERESADIPVPIQTPTQVSERLESQIKHLMSASISQNTQRASQGALHGLETWLRGRNTSLEDRTLAAYLTELYKAGKSPATIGQIVAAVKWQLKHQSQVPLNFPMHSRRQKRRFRGCATLQ